MKNRVSERKPNHHRLLHRQLQCYGDKRQDQDHQFTSLRLKTNKVNWCESEETYTQMVIPSPII
ncbi:unnamed protein product [Orchesella dallaii]|uniref:Uncharacterized protein n=1 Tax=Orchesella dallaii TaxID=48710 RepID=A0ABP1QZ27_9HEXA